MDESSIIPYGKVFVGPVRTKTELDQILEGKANPALIVEMAELTAKKSHGLHDVLLKFTGALAYKAGIDEKVHLYKAVPAGAGRNYVYRAGGEERTRMLARDASGTLEQFQVFLDGQTIDVLPDPKRSTDARPLHMLTAYSQSRADAPSRLQIERRLQDLQKTALAKGWTNAKLSTNWAGLEQSPDGRLLMSTGVEGLSSSLPLLLDDSMGREALAKFSSLIIALAHGSKIAVQSTSDALTLQLGTDSGLEQDGDGAGAVIQKALEKVL